MRSIAYRLQQFIEEQPRSVAHALTRYCDSVPVQPPHRLPANRHLSTQPYWIAFPLALARSNRRTQHAPPFSKTVLSDILWAQYALYLSFRLKDDILDRHIDDGKLKDVPSRLQRAAKEAMNGIFPPSSGFWKYYRARLLSTEHSITKADGLQQRTLRKPGNLLKEYARTSAIFKIAAAALCHATGRTKLTYPLGIVADHLAVGTQIIDDVRDIHEDLTRGRYNYAVQRLLKSPPKAGNIGEQVFRLMLKPGPMEEVLEEAVLHFRRASVILRRLLMEELIPIPNTHEQSAKRLQAYLHHLRVRYLFSR